MGVGDGWMLPMPHGRTSRVVWISWKYCPSRFRQWCPTGPLSGDIRTLTHESGPSYSRTLPWRRTAQAAETERTFLLGKQKQTQWLTKAFETHCSLRTNLGREGVRWDTHHLQKKFNVFQLMQFSMGINSKCMEEIPVLAFPTHPTAGAGSSQLIWFEAWFILSAKSCLKFSNTFIYFQTQPICLA